MPSTVDTVSCYDAEHRYVITPYADPAFPGQTPEPEQDAVVAGLRVPAARSWITHARQPHHDLVEEMLRALPGRDLIRIVGHGDRSDAWTAVNAGPDGHGSWCIPYDPARAAAGLVMRRRERRNPARAAARTAARLLRAAAHRLDPDTSPRST